MDLKEFISETISAVTEASLELQEKYAEKGLIVNPPSAQSGSSVFQPESENYTFYHVRDIEFDVAVTASSDKSAGGKAGLTVFAVGLGGEATTSAGKEQVSRVAFKIPICLPPTDEHSRNQELRDNYSPTKPVKGMY